MKIFPRQDALFKDAILTLRLLPLVANVRWRLWRTPFSRLHLQWRNMVQSELDRAATLPVCPFANPPTPQERALIDQAWRDAHAIRRAARLVPRGSCLTQAMALQLVLARRGQSCHVRIGVDHASKASTAPDTSSESLAGAEAGFDAASNPPTLPPETGRFEAHAWVEWQGRVIMGGDVTRWKPLTVFAPTAISVDKVEPLPTRF